MNQESYKKRLTKISAFVFDVDGVMTNGKVLITSKGEMYREMDTKDGYALRCAVLKNYKIGIISGGKNEGVRLRLKDLGIENIFLGQTEKENAFEEFRLKYELVNEEILYMGDDIPDITIMKKVGISACPNDAVSDVKAMSDYVSHKKGGQGCVRDIIEQVLRVQGKWASKQN
ncbi:MAG: HAD-IIIA family hydrolase [Bacteroidota bacterium]|nr:HAD-IIIA family hydrolase [Bacteroidota bacterium]